MRHLRRRGILCVEYQDNIVLVSPNQEQPQKDVDISCVYSGLFKALLLAWETVFLLPSQTSGSARMDISQSEGKRNGNREDIPVPILSPNIAII